MQKSDFGFKNTTALKTFLLESQKAEICYFPKSSLPQIVIHFIASLLRVHSENLHFGHSRMVVKLTLQRILKRWPENNDGIEIH